MCSLVLTLVCTLTHAIDGSCSSLSYAYQTGMPIRGKAAWLEIVVMWLYKVLNVYVLGLRTMSVLMWESIVMKE